MNTADLTLIELQQEVHNHPENMELMQAFRQMVANWSHLEDCWMEKPD